HMLTVLVRAAKVERSETDLQSDQRVRVVEQSPQHPEHVARDKAPEADGAPARSARGDEPGGRHRRQHGRPLHEINDIHGEAQTLESAPTFEERRCRLDWSGWEGWAPAWHSGWSRAACASSATTRRRRRAKRWPAPPSSNARKASPRCAHGWMASA